MNRSTETLFCRPDAAGEIVAALKRKRMSEDEHVKPPWEIIEFDDDETGESNKVAKIRASGVMALNVEGWYGCCDLKELAEEIEQANNDANISHIVVVIDSPGGTVNGTPEAAARIAGIDKPLMVWTEGELCSAAYYVAASADVIAAAPSATVGSIGCVLAYWDVSKAYGDMGVEVQVFRSGDLKAAGYPGTALTDAEAAHFQGIVDEVAGDFHSFVLSYRGEALDLSLFDGRAVTGKAGLGLGLVDAVYTTEEQAIADFVASYA